MNYLAKFLPNPADLLEPLQQLTHKDVPWQWNDEHDTAFNKLKQMITEEPVLKYYNPFGTCIEIVKTLCASLMQGGQPIAFASRSLTDPETRYAQIEKKMLVVIYALQKFDQYVYGRPVNVESNHKPLESIAKKPLRNGPKRLQGMLLKIQKYDVKITYKPGKEMYLADTLSRAFLRSSKNTQGEFERVNAVKSLPMSPDRLRQLRQATDNDVVLQHLKHAILQGWPEEKQSLPSILAPYFSYRDDGPQFTSESFAKFAEQWGFEHRTSSPGHQQANGKTEAAVKMAKQLMRKAEATGSISYFAILAQRNTPTEDMDTSPAQRLLGLRCKTLLPTTAELLKPPAQHHEIITKQTRAKQVKQAHCYNKRARDLPPLEEGDVVQMRPFRLGKKT